MQTEQFRSTITINLRKAGLITNTQSDKVVEFASSLRQWLASQDVKTVENSVDTDCDVLITLGGDGTMLKVAEQAAHLGIPVIGVNLGTLGFLTELSEDETREAFKMMLQGEVVVENRLMLKATMLDGNGNEKEPPRYGLNDIVINKNTLDQILNLSTRANGKMITTYKADGLVFASATGSTAYSLSAGGPIVHPAVSALLVTPICPFMLSSRPLLLPANYTITSNLEPEGTKAKAKVIIDGQEAWDMVYGDTLVIEQAKNDLQLITASFRNYFQVLRNKLHWACNNQQNCY